MRGFFVSGLTDRWPKTSFDLVMNGQELKALRKARKLTQVKLAEALGVHEITVVKWETGAKPITRRTEAQVRTLFSAAAAPSTAQGEQQEVA